jgi:peptidoglycan L-alanyl-D-glutamate endopeptidase CwlK
MMNIKTTCRDLNELNPLVKLLSTYALNEIKASGVSPLVVETYRPKERQYYLYGQGRTVGTCTGAGMPKKYAEMYANAKLSKVTWTLDSMHIKRLALDVIPQRNGKAIWDSRDKDTQLIIGTMIKYGFEAGANWTQSPDSPHFQIAGIKGDIFTKSNNNYYVTVMVQKCLKNAGYYRSYTIDGKWGKATDRAIKIFKAEHGMLKNSKVGVKTLKIMLKYI